MLGVDIGENVSKSARKLPFEILHNGSVLAPEEMPLHSASRTGEPTGMLELSVIRQHDAPKFLLASASPLFDELGGVRGAVGAFFDVTERKLMDDALRERAELLELASEAIMVRDASGAIRFWNGGAEALYGWKRNEAIGLDFQQLLGRQPASMEQEISQALNKRGRWEGNLRHRNRDGHEVLVASRQAVQTETGAVLEITRDITAQVIAEEALRRNERLAAMGKLAGIVAHEINNPLEAITNAFYLLRHHPSLDPEAVYYAQIAEQELARVSHITKQTLSFYRESQKAVEVSLSELLDDVLELQQRPMSSSNITLERHYCSKAVVHGFPSELKQVFMNLVSNAIQAMPQGGRMRVRLIETESGRGRPAGVQVFISDTGSGITPDHAKRLFEPFFTTKSAKGTGLGLWISRGIVQKHEGTLRFRSVFGPNGAATTFQIVIPTHSTK
ncbi:MAG TPA: ATP-binding protein, partial [Acidobacteriaceae bacterium]|nr:ATP-binding protein [Acidobacteriaceae bacterium]